MGDNLPYIQLPEAQQQVSCGGSHTCSVSASGGRLYCWGNGHSIGHESTSNIGDSVGAPVDSNLAPVNLGTDVYAHQVVSGEDHNCVLASILGAGRKFVKCFGPNYQGELGYGDTVSRGSSTGTMGDALPAVSLPSDGILSLAAGPHHTCMLLVNKYARCFGYNTYKELGYNDYYSRGDTPSSIGPGLPIINVGDYATVTGVFPAYYRLHVLLSNGTIKSVGSSNSGQLGFAYSMAMYGSAVSRDEGDFTRSWPVELGTRRQVKLVGAGFGSHTCVAFDDDTVKCFGSNSVSNLSMHFTLLAHCRAAHPYPSSATCAPLHNTTPAYPPCPLLSHITLSFAVWAIGTWGQH